MNDYAEQVLEAATASDNAEPFSMQLPPQSLVQLSMRMDELKRWFCEVSKQQEGERKKVQKQLKKLRKQVQAQEQELQAQGQELQQLKQLVASMAMYYQGQIVEVEPKPPLWQEILKISAPKAFDLATAVIKSGVLFAPPRMVQALPAVYQRQK